MAGGGCFGAVLSHVLVHGCLAAGQGRFGEGGVAAGHGGGSGFSAAETGALLGFFLAILSQTLLRSPSTSAAS